MVQEEKIMPEMPEAAPLTPDQLLARFDELDIAHTVYRHEPIFTVAEGEHLKASIPGLHCRNLFLRDKKEAMFLVVAANETPVDLSALPGKIGSGRLSFGSPERLWRHLGVRPGSVCPFAVANDKDLKVKIILDAGMMTAELVCYHPLDNTMSVTLAPADLLRFLESTGHRPHIIAL